MTDHNSIFQAAETVVSYDDISLAQKTLEPILHKTGLIESNFSAGNMAIGSSLNLKTFRSQARSKSGAYYKISKLSEEEKAGA